MGSSLTSLTYGHEVPSKKEYKWDISLIRDRQGKPEVRTHALLLYQLLQSNGTCDQLNVRGRWANQISCVFFTIDTRSCLVTTPVRVLMQGQENWGSQSDYGREYPLCYIIADVSEKPGVSSVEYGIKGYIWNIGKDLRDYTASLGTIVTLTVGL